METFTVDKSFYDIGASDLKELWDSDLVDPTMQEVFRSDSSVDLSEWSNGLLSGRDHKELLSNNHHTHHGTHSSVVLHDRLMTDAALGTSCITLPIKTEHSYSLASDGDSLPDSPISHEHMDDMDDDCFPAISLNAHSTSKTESINTSSNDLNVMVDVVNIKDEPLSETDSPTSSCPASPAATASAKQSRKHEYHIELDPMVNFDPMLSGTHSLLKHNVLYRPNLFNQTTTQRVVMPKINIKLEAGTSTGFTLPPTPPSCSSSDDSEDNATSQPASPSRSQRTPARLLIAPQAPTRQPIHTPLISSQPKGSTGQLMLTEEEKRTLLAEGYPVPTRLPLTKAEEKSLKKIRRKIKNKISAQESRRKKKEYMDQLERKVEMLVSENTDYRKKIESLEDSNTNLLSQLAKLQAIIARTHPQSVQTTTRHKN